MVSPLPTWAEAMRPVDMEGAALLLGIARRTLDDVVRAYPHYERRGVKKVFYPEHIAALKLLLDPVPATKLAALQRFCAGMVEAKAVEHVMQFFDRAVDGKVYFIRCAGRVKIGFASDFEQRIRVLKTACPFPIEVVAVIDGDRTLELFLHRSLAEFRRHGEWFEEIGDILALTKALEAVPE